MTLSDKIKAEAIENGLCRLWAEEWEENATKEQMVDKFIRGLDFCIITGFPSVEQMKEYALPEFNARNVYADQGVKIKGVECPNQVILCGKSKAWIEVSQGICEIWVRHDSEVSVLVRNGALAMVRALDNAKVKVENWLSANATVVRYSDGVEVETKGDVLVRDRIGFYDR